MVSATTDFIAVGGNRHPSGSDWDEKSGLLAFGADRNIAIWNPQDKGCQGIQALLNGHSSKVNAVKFLPDAEATIILSGSMDYTVGVWIQTSEVPCRFINASILRDHSGSIICIGVCRNSTIFVSGSADGILNVWNLTYLSPESVQISLMQTIALGTRMSPKSIPITLAMFPLGNEKGAYILAVGGTRYPIKIYASQLVDGKPYFELKTELQGHENWIRSLDFTNDVAPNKDILLASASQDKYIRIWRLRQMYSETSSVTEDKLNGSVSKTLSNKSHQFTAGIIQCSITFEALLLGHEDWVFSSKWNHSSGGLRLLSASADNSLTIWKAEDSSGVWVPFNRLGEISAQKGATTATGSAGGFWTGLWSSDGKTVLCLGRTGSWRMWTRGSDEFSWTQLPAVSGHTEQVKGIAWSSNGDYLLSTGSDQTTRLFAKEDTNVSTWREFSRPQIHGYDLNCIDTFGGDRFISGADEKLLRVFDQPKSVGSLLDKFCSIKTKDADNALDIATIPVLGLSNKAATNQSTDSDPQNGEPMQMAGLEDSLPTEKPSLDISHPPLEDHLAKYTLWPETEKLYGHGFEISAVAVTHDSSTVATACRASSLDHAVIRLYRVKDWKEVKPALKAHSLTISRLRFSQDDKYLLSVGRDRQWTVFKRSSTDPDNFEVIASDPKGHTRMILDASWMASRNESVPPGFVTAGRDKSAKVWMHQEDKYICTASISLKQPVTAVDASDYISDGSSLLALGTESGEVQLHSISEDGVKVSLTHVLDEWLSPSGTINQLSWRPRSRKTPTESDQGSMSMFELAIASEDSSLRIVSIDV